MNDEKEKHVAAETVPGGALHYVLFVAWAAWCAFIFFSHLRMFSDKFSKIAEVLQRIF